MPKKVMSTLADLLSYMASLPRRNKAGQRKRPLLGPYRAGMALMARGKWVPPVCEIDGELVYRPHDNDPRHIHPRHLRPKKGLPHEREPK